MKLFPVLIILTIFSAGCVSAPETDKSNGIGYAPVSTAPPAYHARISVDKNGVETYLDGNKVESLKIPNGKVNVSVEFGDIGSNWVLKNLCIFAPDASVSSFAKVTFSVWMPSACSVEIYSGPSKIHGIRIEGA